MNREQWLGECIQRLRPDFERLGHPLPTKIRASCSWPSKSGLANKKRRVGEAWSAKNSADQSCEVFISPVLKDPVEVSATLVHELVHCAVGVESGHKGRFTRLAKAVGLEGKMTATHAGEGVDGKTSGNHRENRPVPTRRVDALQCAEKTKLPPVESRLRVRLRGPHDPQVAR